MSDHCLKKLGIIPPREDTIYFMEQKTPHLYRMVTTEDAVPGGMFSETEYLISSTLTALISTRFEDDRVIATSLPFPPMVGWIAEKDAYIKDFLLSLRAIYQYEGGNNV